MSVTVDYEADEKQKSEDTVNGGTPRRGRTVCGAGRPVEPGLLRSVKLPGGTGWRRRDQRIWKIQRDRAPQRAAQVTARLWLVTMCPCWFFHCARRAPVGEETRRDCAGGKGSPALPALCLQI